MCVTSICMYVHNINNVAMHVNDREDALLPNSCDTNYMHVYSTYHDVVSCSLGVMTAIAVAIDVDVVRASQRHQHTNAHTHTQKTLVLCVWWRALAEAYQANHTSTYMADMSINCAWTALCTLLDDIERETLTREPPLLVHLHECICENGAGAIAYLHVALASIRRTLLALCSFLLSISPHAARQSRMRMRFQYSPCSAHVFVLFVR